MAVIFIILLTASFPESYWRGAGAEAAVFLNKASSLATS